MNQFKFLTVLVLAGSLFLGSCSKDDDSSMEDPSNNTEKPNEGNSTTNPGTETPVEKKNMISFKIDGEEKSFEYKDNKTFMNFANNGGIAYYTAQEKHILSIGFNAKGATENLYVQLHLNPGTLEAKTYEGSTVEKQLHFDHTKDGKSSTSIKNDIVTLNITKLDLDKNYIEGTFKGEVIKNNSTETMKITEGKFSGTFFKKI